jgi:GntR family transcriptional regulator/MocR family aminotransferase
MRSLYAERQAALVEAAGELPSGLLDVRPADAGMHVVGWLPEGVDGTEVARRAAARGVVVHPFVTRRTAGSGEQSGLMLGYAPYEPAAIRAAMSELGKALRQR